MFLFLSFSDFPCTLIAYESKWVYVVRFKITFNEHSSTHAFINISGICCTSANKGTLLPSIWTLINFTYQMYRWSAVRNTCSSSRHWYQHAHILVTRPRKHHKRGFYQKFRIVSAHVIHYNIKGSVYEQFRKWMVVLLKLIVRCP